MAKERHEKAIADLKAMEPELRCVWFDTANLPSRFTDKTFQGFNRSLQPKAFDAVKDFNWQFDEDTNS